jgi:hypothetical protein
VFSWTPGQLAASTATIPVASPDSQLLGPFLDQLGEGSMLDIRNGSALRLPTGTALLATGSDLIIISGNTKFGTSRVYRVVGVAAGGPT